MDINFIYPASNAMVSLDFGIISIIFSGFPNQGNGIRVGLSLDTAKQLHAALGQTIEDCNAQPSLLPKH
jgi:hypothetical protein